jgi:hypothetical protein
MSDVKSPVDLPILSISVVPCVKVRSSRIPVTVNLPLNPLFAIPAVFVVLCTSRILIISPTNRSCGLSTLTVTVDPLVAQVEMYLGFLSNSKSDVSIEEIVKS